MRIGIVTQHPFPDSRNHRCAKFAESLAQAGHEVSVFTPRATDSQYSGPDFCCEIRSPEWVTPTVPYNPYWTRWLEAQARHKELHWLVCKELRLAQSALQAARRSGVRFCLDLAENYPAMVAAERAGQLLMPLWRATAAHLEKECARRADLVIVVTEANRGRLVELGVDPRRMIVVSNTPVLRSPSVVHGGRRNHDGKVHFVFAGLLTKVRGLDRLLSALRQTDGAGERAHVHIIGEGPLFDPLRQLASRLALDDAVTFHGWVPQQRLLAELEQCDVGVIPHLVTEHTQTTVPNKLFDYMASGLPVWITAMAPCEEIVARVRCGWTCPDDTASLAATLQLVLDTPAPDRIARGQRGRRAVEQLYNWGVDKARLLRALQHHSTLSSAAQVEP